MSAYNNNYLGNVQSNLGSMLDCGVNTLEFGMRDFYNMFLSSDMSDKINKGDCYTICTLGGVELAEYVVCHAMNNSNFIHVRKASDPAYNQQLSDAIINVKSAEYWTGTVIASYAWEKNISYDELDRLIPIEDIYALYNDFKDADELMINIRLDEMLKSASSKSKIKTRRELMGLSQTEIATRADIPVRTLQQYEQKRKNINNAKAIYLVNLSSVLHCEVRDLME
ncbi:MAG: helix-turn-helix domain-containing protein [Lachnospiraceae bacterium]|nr:helix-turn-helix domain-containing protein [Lachnospiraceae bacterium]